MEVRDFLTLIGLIFSLFTLFWVITNARIGEIIRRLERLEDNLLQFFKIKAKKKKKYGS